MKAKFNDKYILTGNTIYAKDFIDLVKKYEGKSFEVVEEPFGGYEVELDRKTLALGDEELIILPKDDDKNDYFEKAIYLLSKWNSDEGATDIELVDLRGCLSEVSVLLEEAISDRVK